MDKEEIISGSIAVWREVHELILRPIRDLNGEEIPLQDPKLALANIREAVDSEGPFEVLRVYGNFANVAYLDEKGEGIRNAWILTNFLKLAPN